MLTMVLVYVNVRLLRLTGLVCCANIRILLISVLCFIMGLIAFTVVPLFIKMYNGIGLVSRDWIGHSTYEAPHMVLMGVAMLMLFEKYIHFPGWLLRIATRMASFVFGIYILHTATSFRHVFYVIPSRWLMCLGWFSPMSVIVVGSIMIVACGIILEVVRKGIAIACCKQLQCLLKGIDDRIESWMEIVSQ